MRIALTALALALASLLSACGGGTYSSSQSTPPSVSPAAVPQVTGCDALHRTPRAKWSGKGFAAQCQASFRLLKARAPALGLADLEGVRESHAGFCRDLKALAPDRRLALPADLPVKPAVAEARAERATLIAAIEKTMTPSTKADPVRRERALRAGVHALMECPATFQGSEGGITRRIDGESEASVHVTAGGDLEFIWSMGDDRIE